MQWVSATMAGFLYMSPKIRLAVLRPTPGSLKVLHIVGHSSAEFQKQLFCAGHDIPCLCPEKAAGPYYFLKLGYIGIGKVLKGPPVKRTGVILFTRSSVHWADRQVAKQFIILYVFQRAGRLRIFLLKGFYNRVYSFFFILDLCICKIPVKYALFIDYNIYI